MQTGERARFTLFNPNHIKMEIVGATRIGELEFVSQAGASTLVSFKVPSGEAISVRTSISDADPEQGGSSIRVSFKYNDTEVEANVGAQRTDNEAPHALVKMLAEVNAREDFSALLKWGQVFTNKTVVSQVAAVRSGDVSITNDSRFDCFAEMTECFLAASAYLGGISALIALCGETLGLGCVGAILAHPILAANVGAQCTQAGKACGLAN